MPQANRKAARRIILVCGGLLTVLVAVLYIYQPGLLRVLDLRVQDGIRASIDPAPTASKAVVVDIDEASLQEYGQWPWPRYRIASLLAELHRLGALGVGIDIVFPEPDRLSPGRYLSTLQQERGLTIPSLELLTELEDNDSILAETLSSGPFVLGFRFLFDEGKRGANECVLHPLNPVIVRGSGVSGDLPVRKASGVVCNVAALATAAPASGFLDATPDEDGILRRLPLLVEFGGNLYPSLALATVIRAAGIRRTTLRVSRHGLESMQLDDDYIPLDRRGQLLLSFGPSALRSPHFSAGQVIRGEVPASEVEGRIVLLGASAVGLEDSVATPISPALAGVDIHATVVNNLLQLDFLQRPPTAPAWELLLVLVLGAAATLVIASSGVLWSSGFILAAAAGVSITSRWLLESQGIVMSPLYPVLVLTANFMILTVIKFRQREMEVRRRNQDLIEAQKITIRSLASLSEARDPQARQHILRTQYYVRALAQHLQDHPRFKEFFRQQTVEQLGDMAALHDIGKVGVPDRILMKSGRLSEAEFEEMKRHTIYGEEALRFSGEDASAQSFLQPARKLILSHHERWDGSGYPQGLKGDAIPVEGRIMAVGDVYDALISERVYKDSYSHERAVRRMEEGRGTQFDPDVLDAFLELQDEFQAIAERYPDPDTQGTR